MEYNIWGISQTSEKEADKRVIAIFFKLNRPKRQVMVYQNVTSLPQLAVFCTSSWC